MSLEKIKAQALEDARKQAEKLIEAAQSGLKMKLDREKLLLKEEFDKRLEALHRELQKEKEKTLSILKARYDRQILELKNDMIDRVFEGAMKAVLSLTRQEYLELLLGWLSRLRVDEKFELRLSAKDLRIVGPELVRRANEACGRDVFFLSTSTADIKGGFVLRAKNFEIDRSLEAVLSYLREELLPQVAEKLFGR